MNKNSLSLVRIALASFALSACSSVFSGGTGGLVVDAESTANPKAGIANVDVYAYMSETNRDEDFNSWTENTKFAPKSDYYGHTTTANDGTFTISRLVWKENKPDFGKDADYTDVYLLFYHENFGLTKGQTVVISDGSSDTVYMELNAIRKTTTVNLSFQDVASGENTNQSVYVKISVPQTTKTDTVALPKIYDATITGTGAVSVSYPRYQSEEDKTNNIETSPEITISYVQSAEEITWKACYNGDNSDKNYAFRSEAETGIKKTIRNQTFSLICYGKATKLNVPSVSGQYNSSASSSDDGVAVTLKQKDASGNYTIDLGQVTTSAQALGTGGTEKHGCFANLGNGYTWTDTNYTDRYSKIAVKVEASGVTSISRELELRSDVSGYTVQLQ